MCKKVARYLIYWIGYQVLMKESSTFTRLPPPIQMIRHLKDFPLLFNSYIFKGLAPAIQLVSPHHHRYLKDSSPPPFQLAAETLKSGTEPRFTDARRLSFATRFCQLMAEFGPVGEMRLSGAVRLLRDLQDKCRPKEDGQDQQL